MAKSPSGWVATAFVLGNPVTQKQGDMWRVYATNLSLKEALSTLECPACGKCQTKDGHDPCIPNLPGVLNACCGHGVREGYIHFEDGRIIRGKFTKIK